MKLLDEMVSIYLPDMKYSHEEMARKYSSAPHHPLVKQEAVGEMYRQVGNLSMNEQGIALMGLLIRHLYCPMALPAYQR